MEKNGGGFVTYSPRSQVRQSRWHDAGGDWSRTASRADRGCTPSIQITTDSLLLEEPTNVFGPEPLLILVRCN